MNELISVGDAILALQRRMEAERVEHQRRMKEDPEYRAERERIEAEERRREEAEKAAADLARREAIAKGRSAKGIPERFWPFLDAYRSDRATELPASVAKGHDVVERFLAGKPGWSFLLLAGPVGTGKTTEAAWFLDAPCTCREQDPFTNELRTITRERKGRFVTAPELVKASAFDGEFWRGLEDTPRLVIDDLGTERLDAPGQALANLSHLLSTRHAEQAPTLITLNLTRAQFEARYCAHDGGRLRDRLAEAGWWCELTGPSLRRRLSLGEG